MSWSAHWKGSVKPSKQRSYAREAPLHVKRQFLAAHLSKELRGKHKTRNITVRVGDKVTVLRGQFRKKSGKVERVDVRESRLYITGVEQSKRDGSKALYPIHPSNVIINELESTDKRRFTVKA
ncbi:50S ribosomal protein L24 [Candidatus Woesearchaeota archaeon]|nr:50S ribosomal protein L24 [Candidatus Woesearchaeota archaeon]